MVHHLHHNIVVYVSKLRVSKALNKSKNNVTGVFVILVLSIFCIMLSINLMVANSVECPDLNLYCCSHNRLFVLKLIINMSKN